MASCTTVASMGKIVVAGYECQIVGNLVPLPGELPHVSSTYSDVGKIDTATPQHHIKILRERRRTSRWRQSKSNSVGWAKA